MDSCTYFGIAVEVVMHFLCTSVTFRSLVSNLFCEKPRTQTLSQHPDGTLFRSFFSHWFKGIVGTSPGRRVFPFERKQKNIGKKRYISAQGQCWRFKFPIAECDVQLLSSGTSHANIVPASGCNAFSELFLAFIQGEIGDVSETMGFSP